MKKIIFKKLKKPFIIAEMSANHCGSLSNALKLIDEAKKCGVDAIKIQTYHPSELTLDSSEKDFVISDKKSLWKKRRLYDIYSEGYLPKEWHNKIFSHARKKKILCFSTPFDESSVDFLEKLKCPIYKIASFEVNHHPLIERICKTKKPIILSTGMATLKEIQDVIKIFKRYKISNFAILKCVSHYPANPKDYNLKSIIDLSKRFNCVVGLSDHTVGIGVAISSIALGGMVVEKHFKLKSKKGLDSKFSISKNSMLQLVNGCHDAFKSLGNVKFGPSLNEIPYLKFRRSIYASSYIRKGEALSIKNTKVVRPSYGMEPKFFKKILGKKAKKNIKFAERITIKKIIL
ncbi:MAG: pseudaminic acid synthase [Euryarchaeota archaeon]|nr:pseudaminic acid synthase [Euryarchaeota archaeon]OUU06886.1 MAG: pseudaminic acid synthase [Gammaproteobacteria bacterium TMED34]|tara:strand:+ start:864 stop:1901 length:1038 start_codon:yes stop_codon:yes gene_type:complete